MKNFIRFGFGLLFIFWGFDGVGQSSTPKECGTREPTKEEMVEIIKQEKSFKQSLGTTNNLVGAITVYIKFHNVLNFNGTGRNISSSISNILYYLNQKYASVNITFAQSGGIDYIYGDGYYDFYYGCSNVYDEDALRNGRDVTNAVNIYFVGTIKGSDCTPSINGFVSDFPSQYNPKSSNAIFIRTEGTDWNSTIIQETIPHEMGHYFNLFHTHQSGGDEVSDTPYDPADKSCVSNCIWNCTYYNPDVRNLMSYYHGCRNRFTYGQYNRMEDYGKTYRTNLNTDLSERYYLDGRRTIVMNLTSSTKLVCAGNSVSFNFGMYGEPSFMNAISSVQLTNSSVTYNVGSVSSGENSKTITIPSSIPSGYYELRINNSYASANYAQTISLYVNGTTGGSPIASNQYLSASSTRIYNATSTCAGNSITIYHSLPYGINDEYDSYWWTKNGQNYTASSTDSYFNASSTGNYTLNMMKCGNVYRSSNSIYLNFYNPTSALTASSNGATTDFRLTTCDGSPVTLSAGCQSGMNTLWNDGTTSSIRYINASSTRDFFVNCNNYFCNVGYSYPVRITALNPSIQSTKSGNWQDPTMWTNNLVPLNCQTVTIQTGHTVNVPINDAKAKSIIIKGNLNFQNVSPTVKGKVGLGI